MSRLALTVGYDGTDFGGSQSQPGQRTVQGEVERALALVMGQPTPAVFAGRTDRGVHASGQVVGCEDRRPSMALREVRAAINGHLPADVAVVGVERRADAFHARFDARWREYRYRVWSGPPDPLARRFVWWRSEALELAPMATAAADVMGRHDFAGFAGGGDGVPWSERRNRPRGSVRTLLLCHCGEIPVWWGTTGRGRLLEIRVVADGFLPRMVRNLVGAFVEVGRGDRPAGWLRTLLGAQDRRVGGATAPPHGLTFWRVGYGDDEVEAAPGPHHSEA